MAQTTAIVMESWIKRTDTYIDEAGIPEWNSGGQALASVATRPLHSHYYLLSCAVLRHLFPDSLDSGTSSVSPLYCH